VPRAAAALLIASASTLLVVGADRMATAIAGEQNPLQIAELKTYDWRMRRVADPRAAQKAIVLVDIDERSLRDLEPVAGRWPWPRLVHGEIVDFLARGRPSVIAYDVDFADADTRTGFDYAGAAVSGSESDKAFADSIRAAGNVILLADASYDAEVTDRAVRETGYALDVPSVIERRGVLPPPSPIADAAAALGHNLFILDPDGPLRHVVPFVRSHHRVLPALGVAAALKYDGIEPREVRIDGSRLRYRDRAMTLASRTVESSEGPNTYSWGLIDYRGPAVYESMTRHTYETYSFVDLLYSEEQLLANQRPRVDPSVFRDRIVFVGATASGLLDVFESPFASGRMPGINVHAAVADDILSSRFLEPPHVASSVAAVAGFALIVAAAAVWLPAWWAALAAVVIAAAGLWLAAALFAHGTWVVVAQPIAGMSAALFGGVAYQYFVEGREKRRVKQLFGRYVSKDVYQQLLDDPSLAGLGGQRRDMTVLFSDIRGFTTLSEAGEPEAVVGMLNEYFTRMVAIVFDHHGTIDKFVGDMVMALFGAPLDDPAHARHAVDAALDMTAALEALNAKWTAEGRPALDIGIGINTGPMIAGNIGSDAIMSYTVIGDAVNLGARLESLNKQYGTRIIISEATRERIGGGYAVRPLGEVTVKGKTRPVAVFELLGRVSAASAADAIREVRT